MPQSADKVTAFTFRSDFGVDLDKDDGWAAGVNVAPRQTIDTPFRIRFEVETDGSHHRRQYSLQYKWNDGGWNYLEVEEFPYPSQNSPVVSIVGCAAFYNGEKADNLIPVSGLPSAVGAGISLAPTTPAWIPEKRGGESAKWEWAVVIRHWSDGPHQVMDGDRFALRIVDQAGEPLTGFAPEFSVGVPEYHLGGTFVETSARIGPWETAMGELYFIMEPTETDNVFMMVKSTDGGKSWVDLDGNNRPTLGDLEGVGSVMTGDSIIHIIAEENSHIYLSAITFNKGKYSGEAPHIQRIEADIDGSWVRGQVLHHQQGSPVYGIVYDAGSMGGSGYNRYLVVPVSR